MSSAATPVAATPSASEFLRRRMINKWARPNTAYRDFRVGRDPDASLQYRFHTSPHIVRALFPGNGAGKTTTMAVECDWWMQHSHPYDHVHQVPKWSIVCVWFTLKFQQFELIREQLERRAFTRGWTWNEQKHRYRWPNGSELHVFSADADWKTAQGIPADLICFDENCPSSIWREMQMRRRGDKKTRFMIAATATQGLTWMYKDIYQPWFDHHKAKGLDERAAMREQSHPYIFCWPMGGIDDNPGMTPEDRVWYEEHVRYGSPAEKHVRTRGGFRDFNATPVFDPVALEVVEKGVPDPQPPNGQLVLVKDPAQRQHPERAYEFHYQADNSSWKGGRLTIYEPPRWDQTYAIGSDTGWGLPDSDYSTAEVFRRHVGRDGRIHAVQVAEAEGRWGCAALAYVLFALGWFYNEALVAVERNNGGLEVARRLFDEHGYTYQYFERKDTKKAVKHTDTLGYTKNDDRLITRLQYFLGRMDVAGNTLSPQLHVRSAPLLTQMKHYQFRPRSSAKDLIEARDDDLIMGAPDGENDDLVTGAAGAVMAVVEVPRFVKPKEAFKPGSLGDILKHADVFQEEPQTKAAFKYARKR